MMNLFQLQEQLKDFSKDQLAREMASPSGMAPPFLVMSELQRRTRMENAAALDKGPPTSTVAQDAVNAAGVPQGGIAAMARSLAPQTDMTQNTGAVAPVQTMQEGGLAGIRRSVKDYGVLTDPALVMMAERQGMTPDEYFASLPREAQARHAARVAQAVRPDQDRQYTPTQEDLDLRFREPEVTSEMLTERGISQGGANPSYVESDVVPTYFPDAEINSTMSGGIASLVAPDEVAPYTLPPQRPGTAEDYAEVLSALSEGRPAQPAPRARDTLGVSGATSYIGPEFMAGGPDRAAQERMEATSAVNLDMPNRLLQGQRGGGAADMNDFLRAVGVMDAAPTADVVDVRTAPTLPSGMYRSMDEMTAQSAEAPAQRPSAITMQDWRNMSRAERKAAGYPVSEIGGQMHFDRFGVGLGLVEPDALYTPSGSLESALDASDSAVDRRIGGDQPPVPIDPRKFEVVGVNDTLIAVPSIAPIPDEPNPPGLVEADARARQAAAESRAFEENQRRIAEIERNAAEIAPFNPAMAEEMLSEIPLLESVPPTPISPADQELFDLYGAPPLPGVGDGAATASPAETQPQPDVAPEAPVSPPPAQVTQAPTGSSVTTSGVAAGVGIPTTIPATAEDRMLQQDKWLALARFGAALSASRAPTFGQAVGEAGQVGLDALSRARQDYLQRKKDADDMAMARATLAARTARGSGGSAAPQETFGLSASQSRGLAALDEEIARANQDMLEAEAAVADATGVFARPSAEQVQAYNTLRDRVRALEGQRSAITRFGAGIPQLSGVAPPPPIGYDIRD